MGSFGGPGTPAVSSVGGVNGIAAARCLPLCAHVGIFSKGGVLLTYDAYQPLWMFMRVDILKKIEVRAVVEPAEHSRCLPGSW